MKNIRNCVLILLAGILGVAHAKSFVWKVEKNDQMLFVGGTVHVLSAQDLPLPEEYHLAFQQSDIIVFETDIEKSSSTEFQQRLMRNAMYRDGRTLKTVLNDEVYTELDKAAAKLGISIAQLNPMRASIVGLLLTVTALNKQGVTGDGIDKIFHKKAVAERKSLGRFETTDQQMMFIIQLAEGKENEFIKNTLRELDNPQMIKEMTQYIFSGDHQALNNSVVKPLKEMPEIYNSLIVMRNNNWLPKIELMLTTPATEYILVGALHLWGEHGVLTQLKRKGYQVTQLDVN